MIRAGLLAGAGLRCCHAAISGGPASAASDRDPGQRPAGRRRPAPPGIRAMARAAPASRGGPGRDHRAAQHQRRDLPQRPAPGSQHGQLAVPARDDHPGREQDHRRADHDQADEQQQQHRLDGRLGAEEQRQVLDQRRGDRQRVRARAPAVRSARAVVVVARFSALVQPLRLVRVHAADGRAGTPSCISRPGPLNAFCIAASWSGSAMTPPTQYGRLVGGELLERRACPTVVSCVQKVEPGGALPHDGGDEEGDRAGLSGQRQAAARVQPEPRGRLRGGRHRHRPGRDRAARVACPPRAGRCW